MKPGFAPLYALTFMVAVLFSSFSAAATKDPLPSWNDGAAKQSIIAFVHKATTPGPDFVAPEARVATFDNDGTLWAEKPMYVQVFFALDRVRELAPQHPEWKAQEPFASLLRGDVKTALAGGDKALIEIVMATHAGMTTTEFEAIVKKWIAAARHPVTHRLYTEMVYQPMLELLAYMRASGFKTFIVSGGGIEFMRPWSEAVYGVPPDQVVGSSIKTEFQMTDKGPVLVRLPQVDFIDDKAGKPVGINSRSAFDPWRRSATPTATSRCWNGPPCGRVPASACWYTTPTRCGNTPTMPARKPLSPRPGSGAGPSWT